MSGNNPDPSSSQVSLYDCKIINTYPHSVSAFTQGLIYKNGLLYESTGLYGRSKLYAAELETGKVVKSLDLPQNYFGEGLVAIGDLLYQLTYRSRKGFIYSIHDLSLIGSFEYPTEGWGLTYDGSHLIMSDGSDYLYYLSPHTLKRVKTISVKRAGQPVNSINELEYINGLIYANVWKTNKIIQIDPRLGTVVGEIDLSILSRHQKRQPFANVLNGIAYDELNDRLLVTGKLWSNVYEIELIPLLQ